MSADVTEWEGIFLGEGGSRPVMSMPPRMKASMKFVREVADALGLEHDAACEAADWIVDKMERFGASTAQPVMDMEGCGPVCSWCGVLWPLCGHHHLTCMDLANSETDEASA